MFTAEITRIMKDSDNESNDSNDEAVSMNKQSALQRQSTNAFFQKDAMLKRQTTKLSQRSDHVQEAFAQYL